MAARSAGEISQAFAENLSPIDGLMTFRNSTIVMHYRLIVDLSARHRLPAVFDAREFAEAGGLMAYGPNIDAMYRRLAVQVDKILHGADPAGVPIELPTVFEMAINRGAAAAIGITLPNALLVRADEVIE